jgi:hypothetical protein
MIIIIDINVSSNAHFLLIAYGAFSGRKMLHGATE